MEAPRQLPDSVQFPKELFRRLTRRKKQSRTTFCARRVLPAARSPAARLAGPHVSQNLLAARRRPRILPCAPAWRRCSDGKIPRSVIKDQLAVSLLSHPFIRFENVPSKACCGLSGRHLHLRIAGRCLRSNGRGFGWYFRSNRGPAVCM